MFGLDGGMETILVVVIILVLIFLVPKKLPETMRNLGRSIGEFRKGRIEIEEEIRAGK